MACNYHPTTGRHQLIPNHLSIHKERQDCLQTNSNARMEDETPSTSIRGYKHRLNQLFAPDACQLIGDAVHYVHAVMCNATLLVKYRVTKRALASVDHNIAPVTVDEREVWNAIRAVQTKASPTSEDATSTPSTVRHSTGGRGASGTSSRVNKRPRKMGEEEKTDDRKKRRKKDDNKKKSPEDEKAEREDLQRQWMSDYSEMTSRCLKPVPLPDRGRGLSVSLILGIATKQYAAAVIRNVRYHYRSYVCCALGIVLRSKATAVEDANSDACLGIRSAKTFDGLPPSTKRRWRREFGKAYEDVLCHRHGNHMTCDPVLRPIVDRHRTRLVPPLPPNKKSIDGDLDNSKRPFVYLGYMVRLAAFIEKAGLVSGSRRVLLSPVPVKTSFVPAHYTIDTNSIVHLLLKDVKDFKKFFEQDLRAKGGFALPGLVNKANICGSLASLTQGGRQVTPQDEELFMDALWTYVARFRNRRMRRLNPLKKRVTTSEGTMRFAHSISTDGYSVTLVCTNTSVRGRQNGYTSAASSRKRKQPTADEVPEAFRQEFPLLTAQTVPAILQYLKDIGCENVKEFVGGDPGKGALLTLVDEFRKKLCYTSTQRRHETEGRSHRRIIEACTKKPGKKTLRAPMRATELRYLATTKKHPGVVQIPDRRPYNPPRIEECVTTKRLEAEMSKRRLTSKTADLRRLQEYVAFREAGREVFETTYQKPMFRAMRFTAWTKRSASVTALAENILEKFGNRQEPTVNAQVVILYGDWGRRPNLKHQAPSPGIGLRRALHGYEGRKSGLRITTITVREMFTSSYDPDTGNPVSEARGVHALLREDEIPGQPRGIYWNRDVLGALNILRKGCHLLRGRGSHPLFGN